MKILAGSSNKLLATRLSISLNIKYIEPKITYFNDSEIKVEIFEPLYNEDVVIVQSTSKPVNDRLIELFLLIGAAKEVGAAKVILVMPYFGYARQDSVTLQNIIPTQLIAGFLEKLEVDHLITVDLHSDKMEKFFNIPVSNLDPTGLYLPFFKTYNNFKLVAPDEGSIKRAEKISNLLNIDLVYITKKRDINNNCEMIKISGSVEGKNCILIDDIIDSGETICKAAEFLKEHSALSVNAFITHAVLSSTACFIKLDTSEFCRSRLCSRISIRSAGSPLNSSCLNLSEICCNCNDSVIDNIFITDTIEVGDLPPKFHIIPILPILVKELKNII